MSLEQQLLALSDLVKSRSQMKVQSGPFAGMLLIDEASWHGAQLMPKIFGIYESELHQTIEYVVESCPDVIINIGCGEGYYSVGLARLIDGIPVYAIDIDSSALDICRKSAVLNKVAERFRLELLSESAPFTGAMYRNFKRPFILMDCEGAEKKYFYDIDIDELKHAYLIVECHDFIYPGVTSEIQAKLASTHETRLISQGKRDPHRIPLLNQVACSLKWLAMSEDRPETMSWIVAHPRTASK